MANDLLSEFRKKVGSPTNAQIKPDDAAMRSAIEKGAGELGIDPEDYATAISYESAGTFDPWVKGPTTKWGQHRGTIQYGEPQRKEYGVYEGQSFEEQVTKSNVKYLRDKGVKPGMGFDQIYAAINGGSVNKNLNTQDWNTGRTIADNIRKADAEHREAVRKRFGFAPKGSAPAQAPQIDAKSKFGELLGRIGGKPSPTFPGQPKAPVIPPFPDGAPVPERPDTLEAQRQAANDPASTRAAVLYTPGEQIPPKLPGEVDIQLASGQLLRSNGQKLNAWLKTNGKRMGEIHTGEVDFTPLLGGKAQSMPDTAGKPAVVTRDAQTGMELVSSAIDTPDAVEAETQLQKAQFPNRETVTEVLPPDAVTGLRDQSDLAGLSDEPQVIAEEDVTSASQYSAPVSPEAYKHLTGDERNKKVFRLAAKELGNELFGRPLNELEIDALEQKQLEEAGALVIDRDTQKPVDEVGEVDSYLFENVPEKKLFLDSIQPEIRKVQEEQLSNFLASGGELDKRAIEEFTKLGLDEAKLAEMQGFDPETSTVIENDFQKQVKEKQEQYKTYLDMLREHPDPNISNNAVTHARVAMGWTSPDQAAEEIADFERLRAEKFAELDKGEEAQSVSSPFDHGLSVTTYTPQSRDEQVQGYLTRTIGKHGTAANFMRFREQQEAEEAARKERVSNMSWLEYAGHAAGGDPIRNVVKSAISTAVSGSLRGVALFSKQIEDYVPELTGTDRFNKGQSVENLATYRAADSVDEWMNYLLPTNKDLQQDFFQGKIPQGLGSTIGMMGGGFAGALAKSPKMGIAIFSSLAMGGDTYKEAKQAGATEQEAQMAGLLTAPLGITEIAGMGNALVRLNKGASAGVWKKLWSEAWQAGANEIPEEITQEGTQTFAGNVIANLVYDPNRQHDKDLYENMLVAGISAPLASAGVTALNFARNRQQIKKLIAQEQAQGMIIENFGDGEIKVYGKPVEVTPEIKPLVERYDRMRQGIKGIQDRIGATEKAAQRAKTDEAKEEHLREIFDLKNSLNLLQESQIETSQKIAEASGVEAPDTPIVETPEPAAVSEPVVEAEPDVSTLLDDLAAKVGVDRVASNETEKSAQPVLVDNKGREFELVEDKGGDNILVKNEKGGIIARKRDKLKPKTNETKTEVQEIKPPVVATPLVQDQPIKDQIPASVSETADVKKPDSKTTAQDTAATPNKPKGPIIAKGAQLDLRTPAADTKVEAFADEITSLTGEEWTPEQAEEINTLAGGVETEPEPQISDTPVTDKFYAYYPDKKDFVEIPDAKPVPIKGFDDYEFAVHRSLDNKRAWVVTEGRSGAKLSDGLSKTAAIEGATSTLNKQGKAGLDAAIAKAKGITKGSPRYRKLDTVPAKIREIADASPNVIVAKPKPATESQEKIGDILKKIGTFDGTNLSISADITPDKVAAAGNKLNRWLESLPAAQYDLIKPAVAPIQKTITDHLAKPDFAGTVNDLSNRSPEEVDLIGKLLDGTATDEDRAKLEQEGAALPSSLTHNDLTVKVDPLKFDDNERAAIQAKTLNEVITDPQKWLDAYDANPNSKGGKEINADHAKELFEEYDFDPLSRVSAIHKASGIISELAFLSKLRDLPKGSPVLFLAGGGGSGKGFALREAIPEADNYPLVMDGVMKSFSDNRRLLEITMRAGHVPRIVAVITPATIAATQNVKRSVSSRRLVPGGILEPAHTGFRDTFAGETEDFSGDTYNFAKENGISIGYLMNNGVDTPTEISLEEFNELVYAENGKIKDLLDEGTKNEIARGEHKGKRYDPRLGRAYNGEAVEAVDTRPAKGVEGKPRPADTAVSGRDTGGKRRTSGLAPPQTSAVPATATPTLSEAEIQDKALDIISELYDEVPVKRSDSNKKISEALTGLADIFGEDITFKSVLPSKEFDDKKYAQSSAFFETIVDAIGNLSGDVETDLRSIIGTLKDEHKLSKEGVVKLVPYLSRFLSDKQKPLQSEAIESIDEIDVTDQPTDTRSDRPVSSGESVSDDDGLTDRGLDGGQSDNVDRTRPERPTAAADREPDAEPGQRTGSESGSVEPTSSELRDPADSGITPARSNFRITNELDFERFSPKLRFRKNVEAIRLLNKLDEENRPATAEEQSVLAQYVGWGGLKQAFDAKNDKWANEYKELKELLPAGEYEKARRSILNSHYTSKTVVDGIWKAVERLGFKRGSVLEPSMGTGNFFGLMPTSLRGSTALTGVEFEPFTSRIAKHLYPNAELHAPMGFQDVYIAPNSIDLAIGNPPFGDETLFDKKSKELSKLKIHAYFFAKSIDSLRPGGVLAMVVSKGFLDARDAQARSARKFVGDRAELVGAIRLPNTAFGANANTEVTTDIIFLQKKGEGVVDHSPVNWYDVAFIEDPTTKEPIPVNRYFVENPDMMLGNMTLAGSMWRANEPTLEPRPDQDLAADIAEAIEKLPKDVFTNTTEAITERLVEAEKKEASDYTGLRPYNFGVAKDGKIFQMVVDQNGKKSERPVAVSEANLPRAKALIDLRATIREILAKESDIDTTDSELAPVRKKLNEQYDAFEAKYGYISSDTNKRIFRDDADYPLLQALEKDYDKGITKEAAARENVEARKPSAGKADIFTQRTVSPVRPVTSVTNADDALIASLNNRGKLDLDYMGFLYKKGPEEIIKELGTKVYEDPEKGWVTSDEYLSGDVKTKLVEANKAALEDRRYSRNVDALEKVIPADIPPTDIFIKLGSPWVPTDIYEQFYRETIDGRFSGSYIPSIGRFSVQITSSNETLNTNTWGTKKAPATKIGTTLMSNKQPQVMKPKTDENGRVVVNENGDVVMVVDQEETAAATGKAELMVDEFADWVWRDADRRQRLAAIYNERFNRRVTRKFDGSHMQLPGLSSAMQLRPHIRNFIYRTLQSGKALADHVVGAGKTPTAIATAMEMRRLGMSKKPMFVVPNHLVEQWSQEFKKFYPGANVLAATKKDFEKKRRKELFAKIATGDWDAVVVAHSSFQFIPIPVEVEQEFIGEQIAEITAAVEEARRSAGKKDRGVRDMEKALQALQDKFKRLADVRRDDLLNFQELGVDSLFVDEAHEYKNLFFTTQKQGVGSLGDPAGSQKAFDMFMKTQMILRRQNDRNVIFLTGTPVSNSLAEIFHMQRYLQYETLRKLGISSFDAWANTFGHDVQDWELNAAGKFRQKLRFVKFANLPELRQVWQEVADIITNDDIKKAAEDAGEVFKIPQVRRHKVIAKPSPQQQAYIGIPRPVYDEKGEPVIDQETGMPKEEYAPGTIIYRMENWKSISTDESRSDYEPKENVLRITNDARKAGLDYRLIDENAPDFPGSKINLAVGNVFDVWKANEHRKGTQLIFLDLSTPKKKKGARTSEQRMVDRMVDMFGADGINWPELLDTIDAENPGVSIKRPDASQRNRFEKMYRAELKAQAAIAAPTEDEMIRDATLEDQEFDLNEFLAGSSNFSAYDDIREKLIDRGVPPEQIAFIHDYNTDLQKASLFAKVNRGDIRILLGSTKKMGAGTNVQKKLVASHNLDVPWKPSDLEQRNGRSIRQGNGFWTADFGVDIFDYATEKTYDARMWEIVEQKGTALDRFKSSDEREVDDVSETSASAAEMKASATGDPRILESITLKTDIKKLEAQKKIFDRSKYDLESKMQEFAKGETREQIRMARFNDAMKVVERNPEKEDESIQLGGTTYKLADITGEKKDDTKRDEAAKQVKAAFLKTIRSEQNFNYGTYRGFNIELRPTKHFQDIGIEIVATVNGVPIVASNEYIPAEALDPDFSGFLQRVRNIVGKVPDHAEIARKALERKQAEFDAGLKDKAAVFGKTAELEKMKARQAELLNELRSSHGKKAAPQATVEPELASKLTPEEQGLTIEQMRALPYEDWSTILDGSFAERFGDKIKLNPKSHEIYRRVLEEHKIRKGEIVRGSTDFEDMFKGQFIPPRVAKAMAGILREKAAEAETLGYTRNEIDTFSRHAELIETAADAGQETTILYVFDEALPEEVFHQADYLGAAEKTILNRHSEAAKAKLDGHTITQKLWTKHFSRFNEYNRIKGTSTLKAILRAEIAPFLLNSSDESLAEMGITPDMRDDYLLTWFEGYAEKNGVESLAYFAKEELHVNQFIEQAKGNRNDAETVADGRTSAENGADSGVRDEPEREVGGDQESGRGRQETDPILNPDIVLEPGQRLRSLPATMRAAGLDAIDEAYEIYHNKDAIAEAVRLLDQYGIEGSIRFLHDIKAEAQDAQHAVLSFMVIKTLLNHAAEIQQTDPAESTRRRKQAFDLGREHAVRATQAGRFTQIAAVIGATVENLVYSVQGIVEDKYEGRQTLSDEDRVKWEALGRQLEEAHALVAAKRKESRNAKAQIKRLQDKLDGKLPKERKNIAARAKLVNFVMKDRSSDINAIAERLKKQFGAEVALKSVASEPSLKSALPADDFPIDDFAMVAAAKLTEQLGLNWEYTPADFKADMISEYGDVIEPYFQQIYKKAWELRNAWLNEAQKEKQYAKVRNAHGEDLTDAQIEDILGERRGRASKRRAIEKYHQAEAKGIRRGKDFDAMINKIADLAESDEIALAAAMFVENLTVAQMTQRLAGQGIEKDKDYRELVRDGEALYKKAKIELDKERDEAANELLEAKKAATTIDDLRWKNRQALQHVQNQVADEIRRIRQGEGRYRFGQVMEASNVFRTLMASFDMSAALRQGGFFAFSKPEQQKEAFVNMFKSIREQGYGRAIMAIEANDLFTLAQRSGIDFAMAGRTESDQTLMGEELFRGEQFIEKIPIAGWIVSEGVVKPSERTYTAFLDTQRMVMFDVLAKELLASGATIKSHPSEFEALAKFINIATGRGTMPRGRIGRLILDLPFFAPRYTLSRLQLLNMTLNPVAYYNMPAYTRKQVAKSAARFYGTVGTVLGIAAWFGLVAFDDDDPDFLKIKIGNTRYDLFAGLLQPARTIIRLIHATARGNRVPGELGDSTLNIGGRFLRGKLSPMASLGVDAIMGSDYVGNEFTWKSGITKRLIPLTFAEIYESYALDGGLGVAKSVPFAFFGIGASTYKGQPERPVTEAEKLAAKAVALKLKSTPMSEQEKKDLDKRKELIYRSRMGESVEEEIQQLMKEGRLTAKQRNDITQAVNKTYLQDKAEGLNLDDIEAVFRVSTENEKKQLLPLINRKMMNADVEGTLSGEQRKRLEAVGARVAGDAVMPADVELEFLRLNIKKPKVGDTLSPRKGQKVELTDEQFEEYRSETLTDAYKDIDKLVKTEKYKEAGPQEQRLMINKEIKKARKDVQGDIKKELKKNTTKPERGSIGGSQSEMRQMDVNQIVDYYMRNKGNLSDEQKADIESVVREKASRMINRRQGNVSEKQLERIRQVLPDEF